MPVTSSSYAKDAIAQADGRFWFTETHTLATGEAVPLAYLAPADFDAATALTAHAAEIDSAAKQEEARTNLDRDGPLTFNDVTQSEFAQWLRDAFWASQGTDQCRICWWAIRRIAAGDLTDDQCRLAFGLDPTAWSTMMTTIVQPRAQVWTDLLAVTGS